MLASIKRFLLMLTVLSPVGADSERINRLEYCYDKDAPESILLARQKLEAVEAPQANIYVKSNVELEDSKMIKHEYTLRSINQSRIGVLDNEDHCLESVY